MSYEYDHDQDDQHDDETQAENQVANELSAEAAPAPKRKSQDSARQRALIYRTARKTLEIEKSDRLVRSLLSVILGCPSNSDDLAYAVITAGPRSAQPATDAIEILDADDLEAGVHAAALGRARLRQVWRLFTSLDIVAGEAPASDAKAAIALVRALREGDTAGARSEIEAALALAKK